MDMALVVVEEGEFVFGELVLLESHFEAMIWIDAGFQVGYFAGM